MHPVGCYLQIDVIWDSRTTNNQKKQNKYYCVNICCWWYRYMFRPFALVILRHTLILFSF
jgi:hypothetical protein